MSDRTYRRWANRLVTVIASYHLAYGGYLLAFTALPAQ